MMASTKFRITLYLLGFAGAALFTILLIRQGAMSVGTAVAAAGGAIFAVAAYHLLVPILLDAFSWWVLFPRESRPRWQSLFWMRWVGESISNLVPSTAIGGDIIRARLVTISSGAPLALSAASVIVDVTIGVVAQIVFTLFGLFFLVAATGHTGLVRPTMIGALIGLVAIGGFFAAQWLGVFRFTTNLFARLVKSKEWSSLVQGGQRLDETVRRLYSRRRGILLCSALTLLSLFGSTGEIWIALYALGSRATFLNALILQSMAMTVRAAAFPVPGQLGVQESGYLVVGSLLGIPGETAFAISLIARFRDLLIGVPGLIAWQFIEGRRLLGSPSPPAAEISSSIAERND